MSQGQGSHSIMVSLLTAAIRLVDPADLEGPKSSRYFHFEFAGADDSQDSRQSQVVGRTPLAFP
jgi:hypothetical protein